MSDTTNDFEYLMKIPEGLLNVRIEASTIREVLLELHTKIEDLNKKMIEFLKSREINQLQTQIDEINTKIDAIEQKGVETIPDPIETNNDLNESLARKIEESKFLLDQSLRKLMKNSIDELRTNFNQSLIDLKDDNNVTNSMKYATIQMFSELQQQIENLDSKIQTANAKVKRVATSEKLSSRSSSAKNSDQNTVAFAASNLDPSPPDSASQNTRISKMSIKLSTLESTFDAMKTVIEGLKKKLNDTEQQCNKNTENIKIIEEKIEDLQRVQKSMQTDDSNKDTKESKLPESPINQYTKPETIIKTVPQHIDIEGLKFEVVQSVLDQVLPFINEYIEKVDNLQNNESIQKADNEKKDNSFSVSSQQCIKECQEEVSQNEQQKDESNKPRQNPNTPSQTRPTRDFSSLLSSRAGSPRATKPPISDPRVAACELQLKAIKNSLTALENAMRSQFGLFDSRLTDLLLRTTSVEKCVEESGGKIEKTEAVMTVSTPDVGTVGCQTVDDDFGIMVDLNEVEKDKSTKKDDTEIETQEGSSLSTETTPQTEDKPSESDTREADQSRSQAAENADHSKIENTIEKVDTEDVNKIERDNEQESPKTPPVTNKTIIKPSISQRPSTTSSLGNGRSTTSSVISPIPAIRKEDLQLMFGTPINNGSSRGQVSSRSNLSTRSHITSQTYEELDSLTKRLEQKVQELARQVQNATDRLGEEDRQIHQLKKSLNSQVTRGDIEELRAEFEERNAFNRKNNPNGESVTALQLKRVVQSFQNSIKTIDKQLESVTEKVPTFVSRQELTELVDVVSQLNLQQNKERGTSTAGGSMAYKCLLCGRPTNQVTGMITESEVARMIGEPPIIGATARASADNGDAAVSAAGGGELVLMYGKESGSHRATSQMSSKRKKMTVLPKILPKTPNLQIVNNANNGGSTVNNS